jgi:hypothetical protein
MLSEKCMHTGAIKSCLVQLIGTSHLLEDIPLLEEKFKEFKPTLVLVEAEDSDLSIGSLSEEYEHIAAICRKKGIPVHGFDVDYGILLMDIVNAGHPADAMITLIHNQLGHVLKDPPFPNAKLLVKVLKTKNAGAIKFHYAKFFDDLVLLLVHAFPVKHKAEFRAAVEKSKKFQAYKSALLKQLPEIYDVYIGAGRERISRKEKEADMMERTKSTDESTVLSEFLEDPKMAHELFTHRRSRIFAVNIKAHLKKHAPQRAQVLTGFLHFKVLKKELFRS